MIESSQVIDTVLPVVAEHGADLYDVEQLAGTVRVLIDKPGGIDTDTLAKVTRSLSQHLDEIDTFADHYVLEVSSPGVERPLRLRRHFEAAIGSKVRIKTVPGTEGERRVEGVLVSADETGCTIDLHDGSRSFTYDEIERANIAFDWGSAGGRAAHSHGGPKTRKVAQA